jgi:hypothetical protein
MSMPGMVFLKPNSYLRIPLILSGRGTEVTNLEEKSEL